MFPHHPDQMSQGSQVSRVTLLFCFQKVTYSVSESVTRSPIELSAGQLKRLQQQMKYRVDRRWSVDIRVRTRNCISIWSESIWFTAEPAGPRGLPNHPTIGKQSLLLPTNSIQPARHVFHISLNPSIHISIQRVFRISFNPSILFNLGHHRTLWLMRKKLQP